MVDGAQVGDRRSDDPTVRERRDGPQACPARPERDEPDGPWPHPELEGLAQEVVLVGGRGERERGEPRRPRDDERPCGTELDQRAVARGEGVDAGDPSSPRARHRADAGGAHDRSEEGRIRQEARVLARTCTVGGLGGSEERCEARLGLDAALELVHPRPPCVAGIVPHGRARTREARPASYPRRMDASDEPVPLDRPVDHEPSDGPFPADPPEDGGAAGTARRRDPVRWRAAALIALVVAAGGVAVQQRTVADAWRDRALDLEGQRDEAIGRAEALGSQLDELSLLQAETAAELDASTERLAELAGEKARAEDRAVVTEAERDAAGRVAQQVAGAVRGLDACILALLDLRASTVDAFNRVARGGTVDVAPLNAQSDAAIAQCEAARSAAAAAGSAASALG